MLYLTHICPSKLDFDWREIEFNQQTFRLNQQELGWISISRHDFSHKNHCFPAEIMGLSQFFGSNGAVPTWLLVIRGTGVQQGAIFRREDAFTFQWHWESLPKYPQESKWLRIGSIRSGKTTIWVVLHHFSVFKINIYKYKNKNKYKYIYIYVCHLRGAFHHSWLFARRSRRLWRLWRPRRSGRSGSAPAIRCLVISSTRHCVAASPRKSGWPRWPRRPSGP